MKIRGTQRLTHPAQLVFQTLRDRTPELVEILPNIEGVEILSREEEPGLVRLHNRWQGAEGDIPNIARPFVKKELISWYDRAAWHEDRLRCDWQIEAVIAKDFFSCRGHTVITPEGDRRSAFTLEGEMQIDPDRVPGLPRFLARKLKDPIERFIARAMAPNLTSIATAVQQYLDRAHGP